MGDDNILLIKGNNICLIFDADFDSYLIDHALAIKTNVNPIFYNNDQQSNNNRDNNEKRN